MHTLIKLEALEDKWHVVQSNFGMWLKGDKTQPAFNYTIATKYGVRGLFDEVTYIKNGKVKSIKGFDIPENKQNTSFTWRSGFLFGLIKSKWQILFFNEAEGWVIIRFSKTLFTKAGEDVIVRDRNIPAHIQQSINEQLKLLDICNLKQL